MGNIIFTTTSLPPGNISYYRFSLIDNSYWLRRCYARAQTTRNKTCTHLLLCLAIRAPRKAGFYPKSGDRTRHQMCKMYKLYLRLKPTMVSYVHADHSEERNNGCGRWAPRIVHCTLLIFQVN